MPSRAESQRVILAIPLAEAVRAGAFVIKVWFYFGFSGRQKFFSQRCAVMEEDFVFKKRRREDPHYGQKKLKTFETKAANTKRVSSVFCQSV